MEYEQNFILEKDDLQQDYLETYDRLNHGYVYSIFLLFSAHKW